MKVAIVLALLAVCGLAALSPAQKSKIEFAQKKKLIGGPNSLPYFLRPGYKGPMPGQKKKLIGGPDSLPYFLKPGYKGPMPGDKTTAAPEQSGFTEDVKAKATEIKNKATFHGQRFKNFVAHHAKNAHKWLKNKLTKKTETPAPVETPVAEQSGFTEDVKAKATEIKNKATFHGQRFKNFVAHHAKNAHKWLKNKLTKKTETPAPVETPAPEQSGFTEDIKAKATEIKNKATFHGKRFKNFVARHAEKAKNWLKNKLTKKTETPAPVETPVAEQSGFSEDVNEKLAQAKLTGKNWWNKFTNKAKDAYNYVKTKVN